MAANAGSGGPESKHRRSGTKHTRRQYAQAVNAYSKLSATNSLYAGLHFGNLAGYLLQPYEPDNLPPQVDNNGKTRDTMPAFNFVTLYNLDPEAKKPIQHIDSIDDFDREAAGLSTGKRHGELLFMRGHPSPDWLLAIGAKYDVEPDFWQRHLDFRPQHPNYFSLPSLPSSSRCMVRLRIPTIGLSRPEPNAADNAQDKLDSTRKKNLKALTTYQEKLRNDLGLDLGDSIVRESSVHDLGHFTVEQDISIHVKPTKSSWIAFIWLDNGRDLGEGATSWLAAPFSQHSSWKSSFKYLPVVQHKPGIALERRSPRLANSPSDMSESSTSKNVQTATSRRIIQSASLLHLDYGRDLDRNLLARDSFYALQEVFSFAAFADAQFLNMLEYQLANEIDQSVLIEQKNPTLSNLLYNQQILEKYILRIKSTIMCLEGGSSADWPRGAIDDDMRKTASSATESLLRDYTYLLRQGEDLYQRCNKGMQIIMNNAMIREAEKAMTEAERMAKLTRLAFVFIPLSFTASFFGMNVHQLGQGTLSVWVWFVVSLPIFAISILSMKYNLLSGSRQLLVSGSKFVWQQVKRNCSEDSEIDKSTELWDV